MRNSDDQSGYVPDEQMNIGIDDASFYQKLLDFLPSGVGIYKIISGTPYLVYLNDGYYNMLGTTREERQSFGGGMFLNAIHIEDVLNVKKMFNTIVEENADQISISFRVLNGKGSYIWLQLNARVVLRKYNVITIYCSYTDIHAEMVGQQQYKQANALLGAAMKGLKCVIWIFDCKSRTIFQTDDAVMQFGFDSVIEHVPESFFEDDNVHPDSQDDFRKLYESALAGSGTVQADVQVKNKKRIGYLWLRIILSPMVTNANEQPASYIGICVDITEQKIREFQYKAQFEMLEQADTYNLLGKGEWNLSKDMRELYVGENDYGLDLPENAKLADLLDKMKPIFVSEEEYRQMRKTFSCKNLIRDFYRGKTDYSFVFQK
ncbi:MAG: PAS domain-containing protein, partial [Clostridia bacterium]|nr:PAS domain-containing protein [Clostridia bacterium]